MLLRIENQMFGGGRAYPILLSVFFLGIISPPPPRNTSGHHSQLSEVVQPKHRSAISVKRNPLSAAPIRLSLSAEVGRVHALVNIPVVPDPKKAPQN